MIQFLGLTIHIDPLFATGTAAFAGTAALLGLGWAAMKFDNSQVKPRKKQ